MSDRFRDALTGALKRAEERQWVYGLLGRKNASSYTFAVPGRRGFVYVTVRNADGAQTVVPARNDFGVPLEPNLGVRMKLEHGVYVILGRANRSDLVNTPATPDYGIPAHATSHKHGGTDEVATATPTANAIPKADGSGSLDAWVTANPTDQYIRDLIGAMVSGNTETGITVTYDDGAGKLDFVVTAAGYSQEEIEDFVADQFTGNTGIIDATYDDGTGAITLTLDVSAADRYLYSTGADAWAEGTITSFARGLLDDADAATMRTTLGITAYDQETVEDFVGAMVSGNTETGISVTYDDGTGKLNFDAQTAGDARYVQKSGDTMTGLLTVNSGLTSGLTITISRTTGDSNYIADTDDGNNTAQFIGRAGTGDFRFTTHGNLKGGSRGGVPYAGLGEFTMVTGTAMLFANLPAIPIYFMTDTAVRMTILGTGEVGIGLSSIGASVLGIKAGNSSNDAAVGGKLDIVTAAVGNVGSGTDTLYSYSVPANTLSANGMCLVFRAYGSIAGTSGTKTLIVSFGGDTLANLSTGSTVGFEFELEVRIYRLGATSIKSVTNRWDNDNNFDTVRDTSSPTLANPNTFLVTGNASGANNNDIVLDCCELFWEDANS